MGFDQKDVDNLLAVTGRRCGICGGLHKIKVHHIIPISQGGSDDIDNGISLCPNCHDEVHCDFAPGRVTRIYNSDELKLHKQRTIDQVKKESKWKPGPLWIRRDGFPLKREALSQVICRTARSAGITRNINPYAWRHGVATELFRRGALIIDVQYFLGHKSPNTTQIYTHMTILDLKEIHARTHPRERDPVPRDILFIHKLERSSVYQ